MGFTKKTWKNRIAEYINRRLITMEDGSTSLVTVARDEGTISQEGDAFNAANMNDLEDRIAAGFEEINRSLTNKDIDLPLATKNCEAWFDNSIDRIGNRVFVNLSVHMKTPLPRGTAVIVAAISKKYYPKAENISFPATSNEGNPLYGYINKTTGRIYLVSPNSSIDSYITASFSYRAD